MKQIALFQQQIEAECNENAIRILIGNKADVKGKKSIDSKKCVKLAYEYSFDQYAVVSALDNSGIEETIDDILDRI